MFTEQLESFKKHMEAGEMSIQAGEDDNDEDLESGDFFLKIVLIQFIISTWWVIINGIQDLSALISYHKSWIWVCLSAAVDGKELNSELKTNNNLLMSEDPSEHNTQDSLKKKVGHRTLLSVRWTLVSDLDAFSFF